MHCNGTECCVDSCCCICRSLHVMMVVALTVATGVMVVVFGSQISCFSEPINLFFFVVCTTKSFCCCSSVFHSQQFGTGSSNVSANESCRQSVPSVGQDATNGRRFNVDRISERLGVHRSRTKQTRTSIVCF